MSSPANSRTALITGASRGLGRAIAERLALEGWSVALVARQVDKLNEVRDAIVAAGGHASVHPADISDPSAALQVITAVEKESGGSLGALINNAGITKDGLVMRMTDEDWSAVIDTNLTGAFMVARQMDRDLVGRWPTTLINVASMYALNGPHHGIYEGMPFRSFSAYSCTKAGIHGLTLWLAGYWAERGATVNTIAPGAVFNGHSEEFQRRVGELIMLGRMAQPDEIADAMLFLCSPAAGYMTGQLINVDGGFSGW
jgi:NAD(P)-dependent dehydrogenase (short-subunit alcohol dehydrogenase family)